MSTEALKERQRKALLQTLHSVNTSPKVCLACGDTRPASQYKCKCGRISTRRP